MSFNIFNPSKIENMFFRTFKVKSYVFDDSDSILEMIGNTLSKVNEVIKETNDIGQGLILFEQYVLSELQKYDSKIRDDVTEILNQFINDGTIADLINDSLLTGVNENIVNIQNDIDLINQQITVIKYKKPSVNLSISPSQDVYTIGESINSVILNINIEQGTNPLVKIEVFKNENLIATDTTVTNGINNYVDGNIINSDTKYYVKVYDDKGFIQSNEIFIDFVSNYYYGVMSSSDTLTQNFVKSLNSFKSAKQNLSKEFNCENKKVIFCYPSSYGNLMSIMLNDVNQLDSFEKSNLIIDGVGYNIYISSNYLTDIFDLIFNITIEELIVVNTSPSGDIDGGLF